MKICNFCNTENEDSAVQCISCGANSFKHKCNNCGTEFTDGVHCLHCGVKVGQQARICPKCHTQYYSNACPTCGFVPNNSPANHTGQPFRSVQPVQPVKPKRKTWLWVLGWIFIFPLPLTLILLKKQNINKGLKYGIIIAAWVVYAIFAVIGMFSNGDNPESTNQITSKETTAATEVTTVRTTQKETAAPTEAEPTEPPTEKTTTPPTEKPTTPPTEAATPIVFKSYTDHINAGETATVIIQGAPNTEYSIDVYYGSSESTAKGLEAKTSDSSGVVSWEWKVGTNTSKGEHSITVRGGGTSETVEFTVG